jgi:hypothetical protein
MPAFFYGIFGHICFQKARERAFFHHPSIALSLEQNSKPLLLALANNSGQGQNRQNQKLGSSSEAERNAGSRLTHSPPVLH